MVRGGRSLNLAMRIEPHSTIHIQLPSSHQSSFLSLSIESESEHRSSPSFLLLAWQTFQHKHCRVASPPFSQLKCHSFTVFRYEFSLSFCPPFRYQTLGKMNIFLHGLRTLEDLAHDHLVKIVYKE